MNTDWLVALFDGVELFSVKLGLLTVTLQLEELTLPFTTQYISVLPSETPVTAPEELTDAMLLFFDFHERDVTIALFGETDSDSDAVSSISKDFVDGLTEALLTSIVLTVIPHCAEFPLSSFTVIVVLPEFCATTRTLLPLPLMYAALEFEEDHV